MLEIGVGNGRVIKDVVKFKKIIYFKYVIWDLFEFNMIIFNELMKNIIDNLDFNYFINILNFLENEVKYDIIFFVNVLYELILDIFVSYFVKLSYIFEENGEIIIIELYFLLILE